MAIQLSLFNHKGGVSKTTTAFNLGWMLAQKGKRVLLADCDPQCNLTGMVLGFKGTDDFSAIYASGGVKNIRDGLAPAFESRPAPIEPVTCEQIAGQPNMHLIPGHIGLAEYEVTLGIAQELSGSLVTLQNLPGSLNHLFQLTAKKYTSDYVIVDMSPSLGPINQNLLMTSDYFLVPMAPDYFSVMATESLASVLPKWKAWAKQAQSLSVLQKATYPFPITQPKFLGTVIQKYRIREGTTPSAAFQKWINEIEAGVKDRLIPALAGCDMLLPPEAYASVGITDGKPLLQMSDFNGLIALSQKHKVPVFALTDAQLEQTGIVLERTKASMNKFGTLFSDAADRIIALTEYAKALDAFRDSINRVHHLGGLHKAILSLTTPAIDASDLLRAQIVLAVSALDFYVHEITVLGMLEVFGGARPATSAFEKYRVSVGAMIAGVSTGTHDWFEADVRERHSFLSFQQPDKISDAIRLFSDVKLWPNVATALGQDDVAVKGRLRLIVDRRNKIAHEADLDPSFPDTRWPITEADVTGSCQFLSQTVEAIHSVVV